MKVKFQLAGEHSALRIALPGGHEITIDGTGIHQTDDPAEVAALDAHPASKRTPKTSAADAAPPAEGAKAE